MGYLITVDIKSADFPMLGNPAYPKEYSQVKDILPKERKTKVKEKYESYTRNAIKARSSVSVDYPAKSAVNTDELCMQFDYEEGTPKTYKFLGMDVDDNYEAIIPLGDGYVKVAPMYDANEITSLPVDTRAESSVVDMANSIIKNNTQDLARVLSTSMKNGVLYDMYRQGSTNFDPISGKDVEVNVDVSSSKTFRIENIDPLVQIIKGKIENGQGTQDTNSLGSGFKSIVLSLVEREKLKDSESRSIDGASSSGDLNATIASIILCKLFNYWETVISKYCTYNSTLAEIDLWSSLGKDCMGDVEFNSKMRSSGMTIQNKDTGEVYPDKIISFAGAAKDNGISDANTIRVSVKNQLSRISDLASGYNSSVEVVMQDLMLGNVEYEDFENPYDLNAEELQAVSSYDSLKYIDEDAKACRESYNMNDPEDRSLFIKSAIKSYDRNFRAFKSRNDYDVAQAFSDMVERGVTFSDRIVSKDDVADQEDLTRYEVTSSPYAIDRTGIKRSLVKVGKMLNKSLVSVNDLFSSVQKPANP